MERRFFLFSLAAVIVMMIPGLIFGGVTGKIAGVVKDKDTGDPLPGVNIIVEGTTMGAATDLNGEYYIINIPPGTYTLRVTMVGYTSELRTNVDVDVDLTNTQNFSMKSTVLEGQAVTVNAERPMIQKDITSSTSIIPALAIERTATDQVEDLVAYQAGVVGGHFRGGRTGEAVYMLDGSPLMDPYTGSFDSNVPELGIEETVVMTGGYGAEYANAQSGIVNFVAKEGAQEWAGKFRVKTSDWGLDEFDANEYFYKLDDERIPGSGDVEGHEQARRFEFSLSGPEPITSYLWKGLPGQLNFIVSGDVNYHDGRFPYSDHEERNLLGKITYKPAPAYKISISGLKSWDDYNMFETRPSTYNYFRRTTYEDLLEDYGYFDGYNEETGNWDSITPQSVENENGDPVFVNADGTPWFGNGQLDTEDRNGNGILDTGEDLDGDGRVDSEDQDHNGSLDGYRGANGDLVGGHNMLDHIPVAEQETDQLALTWSHTLNQSTFYEFKVDRYHTYMLSQINETVLEYDRNRNGAVDESEDYNGNGIWDPAGTDLFRDENNNFFVDASETGHAPFYDNNGNGIQDPGEADWAGSNWIFYGDTPFASDARDNDGFYQYGDGFSFYRDRWSESEKVVTTANLDLTSQLNNRHQLKTGLEMLWYDIYNFEIDMASGGNTYNERFNVYPRSGAIYVQDKMEFEGLVVNAGLRYDFFDPNYNNYPSDINDPVIDQVMGGVIKNPTSVDVKDYWSPRLGVSHPITENDKLYFNYGRYFQVPRLYYAFMNINYNLAGAFPIIGNPNLDPERTTAYEMGVEHLFPFWNESVKLTLKGFYKDITGLTDTRPVYYTASNWYGFMYNSDYGNVRGFEVSVAKRPTHYVSGTLNYTYQLSRGKSSSYYSGYYNAWAENIEPSVEWALDWDQPHTFNFNLDLRVPDKDNPWGLSFLNNTGLNFFYEYGSGMPYSLPQKTKEIRYNTERMPSTYSADVKIDKSFSVGRFTPTFFFEVKNLFNRRNLSYIEDIQYYIADLNGDGEPDHNAESNYENKDVWQEKRLARAGLTLTF